MKFTYTYYGESNSYTFREFAEYKLGGQEYYSGEMDILKKTSSSNSAAIGILIDKLVERGLLTQDEGVKIIAEASW